MTTPDDRSAMALAYAWVARITTISLQMVVPGVIGYWADQKLGTKALFTILGFALGMTIGMMQLLRATKAMNRSKKGEVPSDGEG